MDEEQSEARASTRLPFISLIAVLLGVAFVLSRGLDIIPPFVALLLLGAFANALFRVTEILQEHSGNVVTTSLRAVSWMVSTLASVILIGWALFMLFATSPNPIDRLLFNEGSLAFVLSSFPLAGVIIIAALGWVQAATLFHSVRANAFGTRKAQDA